MKGCIEDQKLKITLSGRNPRTDALKYLKIGSGSANKLMERGKRLKISKDYH
jgi:hypothetical protein